MSEDMTRESVPDMPGPLERAEKLWRMLLGRPGLAISEQGLWHPLIDVYNRPEDVLVQVELPGMKEQELNVSIEKDHLVIEGSRARPAGCEEEQAQYRERPMGEFHRIVHLPVSVDEQGVVACYDDGVLTVTLPKSARAKARKIEIS